MTVLCYAESLCSIPLFVIPWTVAPQALLSTEFSRHKYWSGLPCPPPVDIPNPETEPRSLTLQVHSLPFEPPGKPQNTGVGSLSLPYGNLPVPGIEPETLALQVNSLPTELSRKPHIV